MHKKERKTNFITLFFFDKLLTNITNYSILSILNHILFLLFFHNIKFQTRNSYFIIFINS